MSVNYLLDESLGRTYSNHIYINLASRAHRWFRATGGGYSNVMELYETCFLFNVWERYAAQCLLEDTRLHDGRECNLRPEEGDGLFLSKFMDDLRLLEY